jgi:hypothetical protein
MLTIQELTSRISSADISEALKRLEVGFHPELDTTARRRAINEDIRAAMSSKDSRSGKDKRPAHALSDQHQQRRNEDRLPVDVVLATSMLQVGVDVSRFGLMVVTGQPKNTAEYIQASSRVGRDPQRPGLVVSLGNWARPRDLAHFEQFRHYHETFYAQVEAMSVTPFSMTSMDRGLDGVLVSAARVLQAVESPGLSPEHNAGRIEAQRDFVVDLIDALARRVLRASDEDAAERARHRLLNRLGQWSDRRKYLEDLRKSLVYEKVTDDARHDALMMSAENAKSRVDSRDSPPFVVANSMREVQPEINLLVSPIKDNLVYIAPPGAPKWVMPEEMS